MQLETGVKRCNDNGTMYCTRIQVVANRLYITDYRAIFFDRHYAPARIMLLLELLKLCMQALKRRNTAAEDRWHLFSPHGDWRHNASRE